MPVLLIRHATAVSRRSWAGEDTYRPLDDRGKAQAAALVRLLGSFGVVRVLSSPAVRCVATVEPAAAARGLEVELDDKLFEGNGRRAAVLVRSLLAQAATAAADGAAVVVCSHGDVIPEVLAGLEREGAELGDDGRCQKGSTWVLERDVRGALSGRYMPPPA